MLRPGLGCGNLSKIGFTPSFGIWEPNNRKNTARNANELFPGRHDPADMHRIQMSH
jgi:hypothetical protein